MNKETIITELSRISTRTGISISGDRTLDDYTCDKILDYINEQDEENANLKQALIDIREYINHEWFKRQQLGIWKKLFQEWELNRILKIIDKVLGGSDENK